MHKTLNLGAEAHIRCHFKEQETEASASPKKDKHVSRHFLSLMSPSFSCNTQIDGGGDVF